MTHDVFVSYSHGDKPTADAVVAGLEQQGIRCWMAPRDVIAGSNWGEAIVDAIGGARAMVLVLSSESNTSRQVLREVERAVASDTAIIPFRIDEVETTGAMSYFLGTEHWLDALSPPVEQHIERLAMTIKALLGVQDPGESAPAPMPATPAPTPTPPRPEPQQAGPSRKVLVWGGVGVVAVIVVVLIGVWLGGGGGDTEVTLTATPLATAEPEPTTQAPTPTPEEPEPTATAAPTPTPEEPEASPTSTPTPEPVDPGPGPGLPDGFELFDGSGNGFVVGLPATWFPFDLTAGDVDQLLTDMGEFMDPELIDVMREQLAAGAEVPLIAFAASGDPNMNVLSVPLSPFDTLDFLEASAPEIGQNPGTEFIEATRVDLDGTDALLVITRVTLAGTVSDQHQYLVLGNDLGFIVSFSAVGPPQPDVYDEIMRTFGVVEPGV